MQSPAGYGEPSAVKGVADAAAWGREDNGMGGRGKATGAGTATDAD